MRILAIAPFLLCMCGCNHEVVGPVEVGESAPSFRLMDINLDQQVSSDSLEGNVVVLSFWSTTCANCIREIDELNRIHDSGEATVVGIALDEDSQRVRKLAQKKQIKYQVLLGDKKTFERFDGFSIPYTLVLDPSGRVRQKFFGPATHEQFRDVFQEINGSNKVASLAATTLQK